MEEIRQKLTFEVAEAVRDLDLFQKKLAGVNRTLGNFAKKASSTRGIASVSSSLNDLGSASELASRKIEKSSKRSKRNIDQLTVSAKLLSRIVFTQAIVRGLTSLRLGLEQSVGQFIEFQKAVAELESISSSFASFEELEGITRRLSDNFNVDLIDATRGAYQAVSNQIIKSTGDFTSLNEIALFAVATNSSLESSINLVSGALNAYGKPISQANELTAQFFKTIELGRIRAGELDTALGRISPLASQLGVAISESNAALATLTIGGVRASEAATQIRGALTALIKPSEAMKRAFAELGVETAEELIQLSGFGGALQAIISTTGGTSQELGQLFQRVRGLSGVLRLANEDSAVFNANLKEIQGAASDLATNKGLGVLETSGQKVQKVLNQLSNTLTVDFGGALTDSIAGTINVLGSAEGATALLSTSISLLIKGIGVATAAWVTYKIATLAAARSTASAEAQMRFAGSAARKMGAALGAAFLAAEAGNQIGKLIADNLTAPLVAIAAQATATRKQLNQIFDDQIKALEDQKTQAVRLAGEQVVELRKKYAEDTSNLRDQIQQRQELLKSALDGVVSAQEKRLRGLERVSRDAAGQLAESVRRSRELGQSIGDIKFEEQLRGLSDAEKFTEQIRRSTKLASEAARALGGARGSDQVNSALDSFRRAEAAAEEARQVARTLGDRKAESAAAEQLIRIKENQIRVEQTLSREQERQRLRAVEATAVEKARLDRLKNSISKITDLANPFDDDGKLFTGKQLEDRRKRFAQQIKSVQSEIRNSDQLGLDELLGVAQLGQSIQQSLTQSQISTLNFAPEVFDKFREQLADQRLELNVSIKNRDEIARQFEEIIENRESARQSALLSVDARALRNSVSEFSRIGQNSLNAPNPGQLLTSSRGDREQAARIANDIERALLAGTATTDQLVLAAQQLAQLDIGRFSTVTQESLSQLLFTGQKLIENQKAAAEAAAPRRAVEQTISSNLTTQNIQLREQLRLSKEIATQRAQSALRAATGRQQGGAIYRALGGATRGTDSIPAMLSPGEFVVNARSSRRFFSQLQAINSGAQPLFRQQGGSVTNVTIGDINVTGGNNSRQTGRQIATELRREMRRGTARSL